MDSDASLKERVIRLTKETGVLPCIKLGEKRDLLPFARAMYEGGARIVEVTMTTPGALEGVERIAEEFKGELLVAAGTVLDAVTAREVIRHGGSLIVNPARYGVPVYSGAFTATECLLAMEAGASMVKIFPAHLGGPSYMTNLKMVFPRIDLIPSGGIGLENAGEYIRCGACAVSGARTFMNTRKISEDGLGWVTEQVAEFIDLVREAKRGSEEANL
jgi:2-dehydro-3-deoxyphosphogluconate aldolase/(4S)-4-hydroxy-2-oxoglutarate aldolase